MYAILQYSKGFNKMISKKVKIYYIILPLLLLITVSLFILFKGKPRQPISSEKPLNVVTSKPETIKIDNYDQIVKNLDDSVRDDIFNTIKEQLKVNGININTKITIRENSYKQNFDPSMARYYTEFLIDLPKDKKTFRIKNTHSPIEEFEPPSYNTVAYCPKDEDLIYDSFECKDMSNFP